MVVRSNCMRRPRLRFLRGTPPHQHKTGRRLVPREDSRSRRRMERFRNDLARYHVNKTYRRVSIFPRPAALPRRPALRPRRSWLIHPWSRSAGAVPKPAARLTGCSHIIMTVWGARRAQPAAYKICPQPEDFSKAGRCAGRLRSGPLSQPLDEALNSLFEGHPRIIP